MHGPILSTRTIGIYSFEQNSQSGSLLRQGQSDSDYMSNESRVVVR